MVGCLKLPLTRLPFLDMPPQPVYISLVFSSMVSELKEWLSLATSKRNSHVNTFTLIFHAIQV
jgi:hypothetical protein